MLQTAPSALDHMAVIGVLFLLAASFALWREVSLSVRSFNLELDQEMARRRS